MWLPSYWLWCTAFGATLALSSFYGGLAVLLIALVRDVVCLAVRGAVFSVREPDGRVLTKGERLRILNRDHASALQSVASLEPSEQARARADVNAQYRAELARIVQQ